MVCCKLTIDGIKSRDKLCLDSFAHFLARLTWIPSARLKERNVTLRMKEIIMWMKLCKKIGPTMPFSMNNCLVR
jgi:hypothetical protein